MMALEGRQREERRSATRVVASALGAYAGLLGAIHGSMEILQGPVTPDRILIQAFGPPCEMSEVWHGCWPAITLVPNYLITGVAAVIVSLAVIAWAILFAHRRYGGHSLILLSIMMLPVGGGIIPPLIGTFAGWIATRIHAPLAWWREQLASVPLPLLARLWPWPLVAFFIWVPTQWILGLFLNDVLRENGSPLMLFESVLLVSSALTAFASDLEAATEGHGVDEIE